MRLLALLCVAACGRVGFDPIGDPTGDATGDGVVSTVCVPAAEICNGVDDDCDDLVDEGCPCMPVATSVVIDTFVSYNHPVSTGGGYYFVKSVAGAHSIQLFSIPGGLGPVLPTTFVTPPRLAWAGDRLLAAAAIGTDITVLELTTTGIANQVVIGQGANPFITRAGLDYDVGWTQLEDPVLRFHTRRVDRNLAVLGPPRTLIVPNTANLTAIGTARNVAFAASFPSGTVAAFAPDVSMHIVDITNCAAITLSGDTTGFVATALTNLNVVRTYRGDPDGQPTGGPVVVSTGTLVPTFMTGTSRGAGRHVVVITGSEGSTSIGHRFDVDAGGTLQSGAEMFRMTITGSTLTGPPGAYADAERTALVFSYELAPQGTLHLVQTCP